MATHSSILAWIIPTDRGAWWPTVHGVAKSQIQVKRLSTHTQVRQGFHDGAAQCAISGLLTVAQRDFPRGPVVKIPLGNRGDMGSVPGLGTKIPHAVGQLTLLTAITEPT